MRSVIRLFILLIFIQHFFVYADPPAKRIITLQQKNAFKNEVFRYLRYFRIPTDDIELSFSIVENDNILFSVSVQSRRNNFEEVLIKTYACIGRVMIAVPNSNINEQQLLILPSIIIVARKLRRRDLSILLDASGWAINPRIKITRSLSRRLTEKRKN